MGKTTRITRDGVAEAVNPFCGYLVVQAETADAAARMFEDHPHITVFPGDRVDIMPFLTLTLAGRHHLIVSGLFICR